MTPFISFERAAIKCGSRVQTVVCGRLFSTPWLCAADLVTTPLRKTKSYG